MENKQKAFNSLLIGFLLSITTEVIFTQISGISNLGLIGFMFYLVAWLIDNKDLYYNVSDYKKSFETMLNEGGAFCIDKYYRRLTPEELQERLNSGGNKKKAGKD